MEEKIRSSENVRKFRQKRKSDGWKLAKIELPLHPKVKYCQFILENRKDFLKFASKLVIRIATEKAYDADRFKLLLAERVLGEKNGSDYLIEHKIELLKEFSELRTQKINEALSLDFVEFIKSKNPELFSGDTEAGISQLSKLIDESVNAANQIQTLSACGKSDKASKLFGKFYKTSGEIKGNKDAFYRICVDFVFEHMCVGDGKDSELAEEKVLARQI